MDATLTTHFTNAGVAVLEAPKDGPSQHADRSKRYIMEHVDLGAYYYRKYFYLRGKQNIIVCAFKISFSWPLIARFCLVCKMHNLKKHYVELKLIFSLRMFL